MEYGMATKKITVTLPEEQLEEIHRLIERGTVKSVSGFVQHAVGIGLADVSGWSAMLKGALAQTGGPLTAKERSWADGVLGVRGSRRRGRGRAA